MVLFTGLCIGVAEEVLTRGFAVNLLRRAALVDTATGELWPLPGIP